MLKNYTTGEHEVDFPSEERGQRVRRTLAASGAMIFLLLVTTTLIFTWKAELSNSEKRSDQYLLLVPSVLNAMQITVYAVIYKVSHTSFYHFSRNTHHRPHHRNHLSLLSSHDLILAARPSTALHTHHKTAMPTLRRSWRTS